MSHLFGMVAADMLDDKVLPFEAPDVRLPRILTDRGSEYCGNLQQHEYQSRLHWSSLE
jgi:hypothetical protein